MTSSAVVSFAIFCGLAFHLWWQYRPLFAALKTPSSSDRRGIHPLVRVILCVRGRDPFLDRCIACLAKQDYPNYRVTIVVDSDRDEALADALAARDAHGANLIEVQVRDQTCGTCTRKLASLTWALERLGDDVEIVAQCDGDAVVHPGWLTELVDGLDNPLVAAVSGNRWYAPTSGGLAAISRYYWNAMAIPSMNQLGIPWAGSFAMKRVVFANPDYIDFLQHSFSEDTATAAWMRRHKLTFKPLPRLLVVNEEDTTFRSFWGFLVRQMLAVRLQHAGWRHIFVHALMLFAVMWVLRMHCAMTSREALSVWLAGLVIFVGTTAGVIGRYEFLLRRTLADHRSAFQHPLPRSRLILSLLGLACTGWIYPVAIVTAQFVRTHEWRGIRYRVSQRGVRALSESDYRMETIPGVRSMPHPMMLGEAKTA
jgi:glycosyltransferase involved in cell wall biosynthesis